MRGLCEERPKPLLPLANRPALRLTLERLAEAGVTDALVIIGHQLEKIKRCFEQQPVAGVSISYLVQEKLNGTGGATMLAEEFVSGEHFMLAFGDVIAHSANHVRAAELFRQGAQAVLSTYDIGKSVEVGAVFVENDNVAGIAERPRTGDVSRLVSAGIFVFPPEIFEATRNLPPAPSGEHELTGGIQKLIDEGCTIRAMPITGFWANLTDPDALIAANEQVLLELAEKGEKLIADSARVSPKAKVCEATAIGPGAQVEDAADIRSNVSIGRGSVVGRGCTLESCIVLEDVSVGDGALIENAIVESQSNVPPGAILKSPPGETSIIWKTTYR